MKVFLVAVAGAAGALVRYGIGVAVGVRSFPWATLGINITGSFVLGLVLTLGTERGWPETTTVPIAVGFLGAYTTFSTLMLESWRLVESGEVVAGTVNVLGSVGLGILAVLAGLTVGRLAA